MDSRQPNSTTLNSLWQSGFGEAFFLASHEALFIWDPVGNVLIGANPAALALTGHVTESELNANKPVGTWLSDRALVGAGDQVFADLPKANGGTANVRAWWEPVSVGDHLVTVIGVSPSEAQPTAAGLDMANLGQIDNQLVMNAMKAQQMYVEQERLASTDALTGINNRRSFLEALGTAAQQSAISGGVTSMIMLDIDHFKRLNDTQGHQEGDTALQNMGALLKKATRMIDSVGRLGGEEFGIVLPDTDHEVAVKVAERIRKKIECEELCCIKITSSFGVATLSGPDCTPEALYEKADQALYVSKSQGRNRVTHFRELDQAA